MTVSVDRLHRDDGVKEIVFVTDSFARLSVIVQKDGIAFISTEGTWLVTTKDIDEMIGVLTAVRSMLNE